VKSAAVRPSALPPKTLVLRDVARYLGLGSTEAAKRWLRAHDVLMFQDRLAAEAEEAPRRLRDAS